MMKNKLEELNYFRIVAKMVLIFLLSMLMLSANAVALDLSQFEFVANTTCDSNGQYAFADLHDGNYTIVATDISEDGTIWYTGHLNTTLNGVDMVEQNIKISSKNEPELNHSEILGFLNISEISGMTYVMNLENPKESTVVMVKQSTGQLVANTTCDPTGNYSFSGVHDGDYTIFAVYNATTRWYRGMVNITVNGADMTGQNLKINSSNDIDQNAVLKLLNQSEISGMTYVMNLENPKESTVVMVKQSTGQLVANTTCDPTGNYSFSGVHDGDYTIFAVYNATTRWYRGMVNITVNGADMTGQNLKINSSNDIDQNAVLKLLNQSEISGMTYVMNLEHPKQSTVVLLQPISGNTIESPYTTPATPPADDTNSSETKDYSKYDVIFEYFSNTTSDGFGDYEFVNVPNGDYLIKAVQYNSTSDNWLTSVQNVTVENGTPVEELNLQLLNNDDIDQQEIRGLLNETNNRTTISGMTISKTNTSKTYVDVLLTTSNSGFFMNTTSDGFGNYQFINVPDGDYFLKAVQYSSAMGGMWLTSVQNITINNSQPIEKLNLTLLSNENIDHQEILDLIHDTTDRTIISGKTLSQTESNEAHVDMILLRKCYVFSNAPHLNISIVTGYSSYEEELANFTQRINSNPDLNITASSYITTKLPENIDLSNMDIIFIVMVTQSAAEFEDTIQDAIDNGALVVGQNTYLPESNFTVPTEYNESDFRELLSEYWSGGSFDDTNFDNLIFFLAHEYYDRADLTVEEPSGLSRAIYHPAMTDSPVEYFTGDAADYFDWYTTRTDGHAFDENAPTIGITFYSSYYPDDMDPIDKLIEGFEDKGSNVIACYGKSGYYVDSYLNHSSETKVDAVVSFHYRGNYFDLDELGVPVMNAVLNGYMNTTEWIGTSTPLPTTNMLRIYGPETDGLIDPIMIGALETFVVDDNTVEKYIGHDEQIDWLVERTIAQANLGVEDESDKNVVIIYYNHGGGKDNIGASYLEVTPSIVNLLEGMAEVGYDVNSNLIPNKTELVDLMVYQGRNVGTWAPGELEALVDTGEVVLLPESTYLSWFNELPEERREEVIEMWGEAPGEIMVHTNDNGNKFIVIPKISMSENVILAPQPTRGWLQDDEVLYHDTELPPHHQYIAFYLWLQHEFDADVMVNMGRHGTVEWLPGKDFCLLSDEWPALMVGDIPVIYPYVMDGMGEGMQAKRRGNAVIIDHLIPPVISAGLYGNYSLLGTEITSYQTSVTEDESLKQAHLQEIVNLTLELGLDEQVNIALAEDNETVDVFLEELDDVLTELKSQSMPYGLHVLGEAPEGEALVGMVNSMLGDELSTLVTAHNNSDTATIDLLSLVLLDNISTTDAQIQIFGTSNEEIGAKLNTSINYAQLLGEADNEIQQVLSAMNGEYISANLGGDPVLRPETLPSGSNFYAFDEQLIPTKEAWEEGKTLVDEWLAEYYAQNGEYPTKVGYILWAGESTRHEGIMESQILYMMGIEPEWNEDNNEVEDVRFINSTDLGRPRIDVIVQISGLYRDTFPMKVQLIDKAVRIAYEQGETDEYANYVTLNTDSLKTVLNETVQDGNLSLDIAQFRIFGPADGAYGTGMANAVDASDTWENNTELAELYVNKMSYVYGENIWGQTIAEYIELQTGLVVDIDNSVVFENNLNSTQAIFHSRSSSTYGSLDTDDFYQYMGGLYNAIKYISGTAPEAYVVNLQDLSDMEIQTLQTYLSNELYARYLNPTWISGMQLSGYEGALAMENFLENLWGWEALDPDLITDDVWNKVYDTYLGNDEMTGWLKENNPYAYQSMVARMTETIRKNNWDASDEALRNLVAEQIKSVNDYGATCCHHTCGNVLNQDFVDGIAQALVETGEISQAELDKYREIMKTATTPTVTLADSSVSPASSSSSSSNTGTELNIVETSSGNQTNMNDAGAGTDLEKEASLKSPTQDNYVEGYEMTKESTDQNESNSNPSISGSDVIASLFVLGGVGAIYIGFVRRRKI